MDSSEGRRRYATQVRRKAELRSKRLIEALETVAREDFLGPPPWRITRLPNLWNREFSSDLAQVYDDVVVALDPARHLNNGLPSALTALIDSLELKEGQTVLHAGTGTGYYTALIAHCVGEGGRVVGLELDPQLAKRARENLKQLPQVERELSLPALARQPEATWNADPTSGPMAEGKRIWIRDCRIWCDVPNRWCRARLCSKVPFLFRGLSVRGCTR